MLNDEFALRLAQLRTEAGKSARDMSLSIGQNAGYINDIESGRALPSMQSFFYICEYLDISPNDFFDTESRFPEKINSILTNLKKLNDSQLDAISLIVNDLSRKQ